MKNRTTGPEFVNLPAKEAAFSDRERPGRKAKGEVCQ